MATNKPQVKAFIEADVKEKFEIICKNENRSISNMLEVLIKEKINKYEMENGNINNKTINIQSNQNGNINYNNIKIK